MPGPAAPAMATAEWRSAGITFSIVRWLMRLPDVARRSPALGRQHGLVVGHGDAVLALQVRSAHDFGLAPGVAVLPLDRFVLVGVPGLPRLRPGDRSAPSFRISVVSGLPQRTEAGFAFAAAAVSRRSGSMELFERFLFAAETAFFPMEDLPVLLAGGRQPSVLAA